MGLQRDIQTAWSSEASSAAARGFSASDVVGKPVTVLFPPGRAAEADQILQRIRQGESFCDFETVRLNRHGQPIDVTLTAVPIRASSGEVTGTLTMARDARLLKQTEQALQDLRAGDENRILLLETVSRVALDILASRTGIEALSHIAEAARTMAGAQYAALGVARQDGKGLMEFVTVGLTQEQESAIGSRPHGIGVLGLLLQRSEPLRIGNLGDHPASAGFPPNHPPMASFLGVPIRQGEKIVGSLYLTDKIDGAEFTEADEEAVQSLGAHAAVAIQNLQMILQQRALVRGLISAQEEERRAVAYDLHDGLTQYVMAAHAHLEAFRHAHGIANEARAQREIQQAAQYLKEAVVESRRLVNGLRSLALDDLGLSGAVEQLFDEEKTRAQWEEADLLHNIEGVRFDRALEAAVYRVAQEALTNVRKHAQASRVRLMILWEPAGKADTYQLALEVQDWGRGFDPERSRRDDSHVGLHGMSERASLMGGSFELRTSPEAGTLIRAVFPAAPT